MHYKSELELLRSTFKKCHIQTLLAPRKDKIDSRLDLGLMQLLGKEELYNSRFEQVVPELKHNTIYKLNDSCSRNYIFMLLPDITEENLLIIGPYLSKPLSAGSILENAEKLGLAPQDIKILEHYYGSIPILSEESHLFALVDSFGESVFHSAENFTVLDVNRELLMPPVTLPVSKAINDTEKAVWNMQLMEKRYSYENELMEAVTKGQLHKTELLLSGLNRLAFERRLSDPLRELKNYSIIMNTLLRKAAENGGVHPIYLDSMSSDFAIKIEKLSTVQAVESLMTEIFRSYCRLVKNHSTKNYSPTIQKTITIIDYDLTANLSLNALADMQNVNASYLSSRFKKETGQTLTEYVNQKRIANAKRLLKTTNLQIQTVAQYCGILDLHYFSKLFKKQCGLTPKEYREKNQL